MLGDHRIEPVQALGDACHDLHGEWCDIVELLGVLAHPATLLSEFDDIGIAQLRLEQERDGTPARPVPGPPAPVIDLFRHDQSFTRLR